MGKNTGSSEINNANTYYGQLSSQGQQLFGQYFPILQQLFPELLQNVQGTPNAATTQLEAAAQAPVQAQTSNAINTMQNNLGGVVNPNAVWQNIAQSGQQNSALASDNILSTIFGDSLSSLTSLINASSNQSGQDLNSAAGGEANIGTNLAAQNANFWSNVLGDVGAAFGAKSAGNNSSSGTNNSTAMNSNETYGAPSSSNQYVVPSNFSGTEGAAQSTFGPGAATNTSGGSTPISAPTSSSSPWQPSTNTGP